MDRDPFNDDIKQIEPNKGEKGYAWKTAIGLQVADGAKPSRYLMKSAIQNEIQG